MLVFNARSDAFQKKILAIVSLVFVAVIGVEPGVKFSFVLSGIRTKLKGQYNAKSCRIDPFASFACQTADSCDKSNYILFDTLE